MSGGGMMPAAVVLRDLRLEAGGRCLLAVPSLVIHPGERVAVVGPNGAGKSTLLKVLGGFLPVREGHVQVLGRTLAGEGHRRLTAREWRRWRAEVGQVMQGLHLVARLSALENVVLGALARPGAMPIWRSCLRWYPGSLLSEAAEALAAVGLAARLHTRADQLSGGERQKVSLARLRLQRPRLILADEPTSALDPAATQQACEALCGLGCATLITVVHDTALLHRLADRVLGVQSGRVVFDLPTGEVSDARLQDLYGTRGAAGLRVVNA